MDNPFANCEPHPGWYFAHVTGPDGPAVVLVRFYRHAGPGIVSIPDEGRTESPEQMPDGSWWLHKWQVHKVEPVVFPVPEVSR